MMADDLTHEESRQAMDIILERTDDFHRRGIKKDILTVDNHVDGVYLYLKLREKDPERAEEVRQLLLKGRCSACQWLNACGGALRVRADLVYKDPWAPDPACYLSDEEIGLTEEKKKELAARGEEFQQKNQEK